MLGAVVTADGGFEAQRTDTEGVKHTERLRTHTAAVNHVGIAAEGVAALRSPPHPPDLIGYVGIALRGGLPEVVLQLEAQVRRRRLTSYVDEIVARDGALVDGSRDPVRLRRYLQAWAANIAGVVEHRTLYEAAEINRATAVGYDTLLTALLVVDPLPAWSTNRLSRLTGRPKRHMVEPTLVGPLLGVDEDGVLRDPALMGRLLESFVVAQVRPELALPDLLGTKSARGGGTGPGRLA